ncbi:MAG: hypothetical protein ACRCV9_08865 [Burkholderiaceae bacterium]
MDRSSQNAFTAKPKSMVALSELPALVCAALAASPRQITLAAESPAEMVWFDTPECVEALRAWLKNTPHARLRLLMRAPRDLAPLWPRTWNALTWYAHQVQALVPARETIAELDGIVFEGHSVIYRRRDAMDWHRLTLPRNAVAMAMAEQLLSGIEFASEQGLGTTGLAG